MHLLQNLVCQMKTLKKVLVVASRGRPSEHQANKQQLEPNYLECTNAITTVAKDNLVLEIRRDDEGVNHG